MKNNLGTRLLSVFLALSMVVVLMPAMLVSASEAPMEIPKYDQPINTLPVGPFASSTYSSVYAAKYAFDGNKNTRWNASPFSYAGEWVGLNFGKTVTVDTITLCEEPNNTDLHLILGFSIQVAKAGDTTWETVYEGMTIGSLLEIKLDKAISFQYIRIYIEDLAKDSLTISEISFSNAGTSVFYPILPDYPLGISAPHMYNVQYSATMAYDKDNATRWNGQPYTYAGAWLALNFGEEKTIDRAVMIESLEGLNFVQAFQIDAFEASSNTWKTVYQGGQIGEACEAIFAAPVTTQFITLTFTDLGGKDCNTLTELAYFNGKSEVRPIEVADDTGHTYSASTKFSADYDAKFAFDGDLGTRWATIADDRAGSWIMAEFGEEVSFDKITLAEGYNRVQSFILEGRKDGEWSTFYTGTTIGDAATVTFDKVTVDAFRLTTLTAVGDPTFWEISFFDGNKNIFSEEQETVYLKGTDLSDNASVIGSQILTSTGWFTDLLKNNVIETVGGYTTLGQPSLNADVYVGYDFGAPYAFDEIVLYSAYGTSDNPDWSGIPKTFDVEISNDGLSWEKVQSFTNDAVASQAPLSCKLDKAYEARYVIIRSTELYPKADGNYIQLAEMDVYYQKDSATVLTSEGAFSSYLQTRDTTANEHDMRILLVARLDLLADISSVDVTVTYTLSNGGTKTLKGTLGGAKSDYQLYRKVTAAGETYVVDENMAIFGNVITGIPNGAYSNVSVTIANGNDVLYQASLN